ncbi:MAG TPA: hypothetical protein ACFE0H_08885 [Elainellaceae cyanobacterium]
MQTFLTFAFDAVFLTGSGYLFTGFILGLVNLWHRSHPDIAAPLQPSNQTPYPLTPVSAMPIDKIIEQATRQREYEPIDSSLER